MQGEAGGTGQQIVHECYCTLPQPVPPALSLSRSTVPPPLLKLLLERLLLRRTGARSDTSLASQMGPLIMGTVVKGHLVHKRAFRTDNLLSFTTSIPSYFVDSFVFSDFWWQASCFILPCGMASALKHTTGSWNNYSTLWECDEDRQMGMSEGDRGESWITGSMDMGGRHKYREQASDSILWSCPTTFLLASLCMYRVEHIHLSPPGS